MRKRYCGTPPVNCSGSKVDTHMGHMNLHNTPEEAFKCYSRYLVDVEGFEQIESREFRAPEKNNLGVTGILIIAKKSKFGTEFRGGKREKLHESKRVNLKSGRGGFVGRI